MKEEERKMTELGTQKLWIDGEPRDARSGETFDTYNPATGTVLAKLPRARKEDANDAALAARRAYAGAWGKMAVADRARILWKAGELIMQHAAELARLET